MAIFIYDCGAIIRPFVRMLCSHLRYWQQYIAFDGIDGNYLVITPIFKKYGNLPLYLENYALFSLTLIFKNNLYTYTLRNIIYLGEPSGNFNFKLPWHIYTQIHA